MQQSLQMVPTDKLYLKHNHLLLKSIWMNLTIPFGWLTAAESPPLDRDITISLRVFVTRTALSNVISTLIFNTQINYHKLLITHQQAKYLIPFRRHNWIIPLGRAIGPMERDESFPINAFPWPNGIADVYLANINRILKKTIKISNSLIYGNLQNLKVFVNMDWQYFAR